MLKILKNQDGFSGLIGILIAIVIIGIMSAMMLPTFTARMDYKQAQYVAGVTKTIENAENAYMAKTGSFLDLTDLGSDGYLSPNFLTTISETSTSYTSGSNTYYTSTWTGTIENKTVSGCITDYPSFGTGCPNNPGVSNGYYLEISNILVGSSSVNYANYIASELPGSGIAGPVNGFDYVSYEAPVPSAPPIVVPDNGATPAAKYAQSWISPGFYQWTVPSGVTVVGVTLAGGNGGGGNGGKLVDQLLNVSPGETLDIYVAENGGSGGHHGSSAGGYGYGYGGSGAMGCNYYNGGGGGGSSAVVASDTGQVILAPGGGGDSYAGGCGSWQWANGGGGGGYNNGGNGAFGPWSYGGGAGGYGGGGNGGYGAIPSAGNGGYPGGAGYSNGAFSGIIPGPGYGFVEIQWN